jgi:hypothetical protein
MPRLYLAMVFVRGGGPRDHPGQLLEKPRVPPVPLRVASHLKPHIMRMTT